MNKVTNELLRQEGLKLRLKILGLDSIHVAKGILGKEGLKLPVQGTALWINGRCCKRDSRKRRIEALSSLDTDT